MRTMFRRHVEPGLPSWPPLFVDYDNCEAFITMRIADWKAMERGIWAAEFVIFLQVILTAIAAWQLIPNSKSLPIWVVLFTLPQIVAFLICAPAIRSLMPGFLSRFLFARRIKICFTQDFLAFRSWYYDNGVRVGRSFDGDSVAIQPVVEDDREAKLNSDLLKQSNQNKRARKRGHLNHASQLVLLIRAGTSPLVAEDFAASRQFRTLPVATMDNKLAERFVILIDKALELTTSTSGNYGSEWAGTGQDLDLQSSEKG